MVGSTFSETEAGERFAEAAAELLGSAAGPEREGLQELVQLQALTPQGCVFVVRDGGHFVAALTGREPTVGLVFYDLKTCLRLVQRQGRGEEARHARRRRRRPVGLPKALAGSPSSGGHRRLSSCACARSSRVSASTSTSRTAPRSRSSPAPRRATVSSRSRARRSRRRGDDRRRAGRLIREHAYLEGDFVLRSGRRSRYYLDKYRFETEPRLLGRSESGSPRASPPSPPTPSGWPAPSSARSL